MRSEPTPSGSSTPKIKCSITFNQKTLSEESLKFLAESIIAKLEEEYDPKKPNFITIEYQVDQKLSRLDFEFQPNPTIRKYSHSGYVQQLIIANATIVANDNGFTPVIEFPEPTKIKPH